MSEKDSKLRSIVYVGNDVGFFATIKLRYETAYSEFDFEFHSFDYKLEDDYQSTFIDILDCKPHIIYMDFSFKTESQFLIAQLVTRENSFDRVPVVGLVDATEKLKISNASGVHFSHIKCGEYHDIVFDPMFLSDAKKVKVPQFARAKFIKDVELYDDFRIGYITPTSIHAEGNLELKVGDYIYIDSAIPEKLIPSKKFLVKNTGKENLYYDYRFWYDLEFEFAEEPEYNNDLMEIALGEEDEKRRLKLIKSAKLDRRNQEEEYNHNLRSIKKKHQEWVLDNMSRSYAKKTKILIIDTRMSILKDEETPIDTHPYTIRCQTVLTEKLSEIERVRPSIVAIQLIPFSPLEGHPEVTQEFIDKVREVPFDELTMEEQEVVNAANREAEQVGMNQLKNLMEKIKSSKNYTPFVVLFNSSKYTSKALQDNFRYPLIISNIASMDLTTVLGLAEVFEQKQETAQLKKIQAKILELRQKDAAKYGRLQPEDFKDKRYYVKKTSDLSFVSSSQTVTINTMTESDLTFLSSKEMELRNYRINFPVPLSVRLVPVEGQNFIQVDGKYQYKGLIHGVDEDDKKAIRQFVNEIFFSPLNEEREKEKINFKDLNEKALRERLGLAETDEIPEDIEGFIKLKEEEARLAAAEAEVTENNEDSEKKDPN